MAADPPSPIYLVSDSGTDDDPIIITNATAHRLRPVRPQDAWAQRQLAGRSDEPVVLREYVAPRAAHQLSLSGSAAATMTATAAVATVTAATTSQRSHEPAMRTGAGAHASGRPHGGGGSGKERGGVAVATNMSDPLTGKHGADRTSGQQDGGAAAADSAEARTEAPGAPLRVRGSEAANEASSPVAGYARLEVDGEEAGALMLGAAARDPPTRRGGQGASHKKPRTEEDEAEAEEEDPQPCSSPGIAARTKQRKRSSAALAAAAIVATATEATSDDDADNSEDVIVTRRRRPPPSALAQAWARLPVPPRVASPGCMWLLGYYFDPETTQYVLAARHAALEQLGDAVDQPYSLGPDGVHLLALVGEPNTMQYWGAGGGREPTER